MPNWSDDEGRSYFSKVECKRCLQDFDYDKKTGELVYEFESANKASLTIRGKRGTGLISSLKNPGKNSWMGCYWYYKT